MSGLPPRRLITACRMSAMSRHFRRTGHYGISDSGSASLRLDVGSPDHFGPLLGFVGDQPAKVGGRARQRRTTHIGKPRLERGVGKRGVDLLVERADDLSGCASRHADTVPSACLVTWYEIVHGGDFG